MESSVELRFGTVVQLYYQSCGIAQPKQLDLIDHWFPGMIVREQMNPQNLRTESEYSDTECMIQAVKVNDSLYVGGSKRVSQILGRLIGNAKGNQEKERRSGMMIQRQVAEKLVNDMSAMPKLQANTVNRLKRLNEEQYETFCRSMMDLLYGIQVEKEADIECLYPLFPSVTEGIVLNAAKQLNTGDIYRCANAFLWLLLGGLLRNEAGRILQVYDSYLIAVRRKEPENESLHEKLDQIFYPELFEYYYDGDDFEHRFPGIEWYCDYCDEHLNEQEGFDDHQDVWKCTRCGYENIIDIREIYHNKEDALRKQNALDPEKFEQALENRKKKL